MRRIDLDSWSRREHFRLFTGYDHPHFGMCANVDLTAFHAAVKGGGYSISVAIVYVLARAANSVAEFRQRIRGDGVVEHDVVHPSTTILAGKELFSFCKYEYLEDFVAFAAKADARTAYVLAHPTVADEPGEDNLLFMTAIPWVSFTSFEHPMHLQSPDSIPRFAWGKFFEERENLKMPLAVQGHHALMDGIHVGRFYEAAQACFDQFDTILDSL